MTKILIVDSLEADRAALRWLLESKGYQVIEAADESQALAYAQECHPDLVLLEHRSAEQESDTIIAALRANAATGMLPVILLAASEPDPNDPAYELDHGVECVIKPINERELLLRIRSALRTSQVQAELQRRNEQLSALVNVMDAANSTLDLRDLAQRVIKRALIVTSMVSGSIWLRERDELVCLAQYPHEPLYAGLPERQRLDPDTPLGHVVTTGYAEFANGSAPAGEDAPDAVHLQSAAILPLMAKDNLIGALVLAARAGERVPPEERPVLGAIATHVAVAIQHAQLYQQAERQRRQLQAIDKQKDEFISITSHELKNPMASIKGYADLMLRRIAKNPGDPNRKALEIISQQVNRMTSLLDQLLDVSRIGMDRLQLDRHPADLAAIVWQVVEEMRATTDQHQLTLEMHGVPLTGNFDSVRIGQVISNLLSNAIKYSPNGGTITVHVERTAPDGNPEAIISVSDPGIGIPAEDREHLFERFFRASNAGAAFSGMGLGLFITRGLVVRHSGQIWVESEEGRGTTFHVALPLEPSEG